MSDTEGIIRSLHKIAKTGYSSLSCNALCTTKMPTTLLSVFDSPFRRCPSLRVVLDGGDAFWPFAISKKYKKNPSTRLAERGPSSLASGRVLLLLWLTRSRSSFFRSQARSRCPTAVHVVGFHFHVDGSSELISISAKAGLAGHGTSAWFTASLSKEVAPYRLLGGLAKRGSE